MSLDIVARLVRWHTAMADEPKRAESKRTKHRETADLIEQQAEELAALREQLAEREAEVSDYKCRAQMNADAIQHYSELAEKATAECEHWKKNAASCHIERDVHAAMIERAEKAEAEVARLKAHAEAMAEHWEKDDTMNMMQSAVDAYRRDYPEGTT